MVYGTYVLLFILLGGEYAFGIKRYYRDSISRSPSTAEYMPFPKRATTHGPPLSASSPFSPWSSGRRCKDCYSLISCQAALDHLKASNNRTNSHNQLRKSHCGFTGGIPKVCCKDFRPLSTATDVPLVDSVENHPKLNLLPEDCGEIYGDRIIGGSIAMLHEFPWMALISYRVDNSLKFLCGGSLINNRYVVTAAHCIKKNIAGVRLGEHDIDKKLDCEGDDLLRICESHLQDVEIEQFITHDFYKEKPVLYNDIAMLRLAEPADFSFRNVAPICLPATRDLENRNIGGERAVVAGWGRTEENRFSSVLRKVKIPVGTATDCVKHQGRGLNDTMKNKICAGEQDKDSCNRDSGGPLILEDNIQTGLNRRAGEGDSGGPLMAEDFYKTNRRYILYGIVSYGRRNCGEGIYPGVYTDVTKYMTWILDHLEP